MASGPVGGTPPASPLCADRRKKWVRRRRGRMVPSKIGSRPASERGSHNDRRNSGRGLWRSRARSPRHAGQPLAAGDLFSDVQHASRVRFCGGYISPKVTARSQREVLLDHLLRNRVRGDDERVVAHLASPSAIGSLLTPHWRRWIRTSGSARDRSRLAAIQKTWSIPSTVRTSAAYNRISGPAPDCRSADTGIRRSARPTAASM
jgi:hypothetical protein